MALTKLQFRPGINRETTAYTNEGGWFDCDKIRFRAGYPETIGGWSKYTATPLVGPARALHTWGTLDGTTYVSAGTSHKYYVVRGGATYDITPIRLTTDPGDVTFAATDGSDQITVTNVAHGALAGDYVTFSGAVSLGGAVTADLLNAEHVITSVTGNDTYIITLSVEATSGDTGNGGASTIGAYQLNGGLDVTVLGPGWGAGSWGRGGWGSAASTAIVGQQLRLWSQDNYGEDLVFNARDGNIYLWDASGGVGTRAVALEDAPTATAVPTIAKQVLVSERDRHVIAFGCDDQFSPGVQDTMLIRFSTQENALDWDTTNVAGTAGSFRLGSGSTFVTAVQTRQQILVLTDTAAHTMQFVGPPYTFALQEVAANVTIMGPNAAVSAGDMVFWMGSGEFYMFNGVVSQLPCDVKEFVFSNLNATQNGQVFAAHNSAFSEVWWFYPSSGSNAVDRYVVYDYAQNLWYYGSMGRTAWIDRGAIGYPVASGYDGHLYYHEFGLDDGMQNPPAPLAAFVESSVVDLGEGDVFMFATRLIPDLTFRSSTNMPVATMTLKARNFPGDPFSDEYSNPVSRTAVVPVEQSTRQVFLRLRGRAMSLRVESNQTGTAWRLGSPRLELRSDGKRA